MEPTLNLAETAVDNGNFKILVDVLGILDGAASEDDTLFLPTLTTPGAGLTVFAPTDTAFLDLAVSRGFDATPFEEDGVFIFNADGIAAVIGALAAEFGVPALRTVVEYHVLTEVKDAGQIGDAADAGDVLTTLNGLEIGLKDFGDLKLNDLDLTVEDPTVIIPNVGTTNGIIHAIDKVLLPLDVDGDDPAPAPTLFDAAATTPGFEILAAVVLELDSAAGPDDLNLQEALSAHEADLTVFAPTNTAFANLAVTLTYAGPVDVDTNPDALAQVGAFLLNNVPIETLRDVVEYHVVGGAKDAAMIDGLARDNQDLVTLGGGTIDLNGFNLAEDATALGDNDLTIVDPNVVLPNVAVSNGIIHGIDNVLLPIDLAGDDPNVVDKVIELSGDSGFDDNGADFDFLRTAVIEAGLDGPLSNLDVTVFAPTDEAFLGVSKALGFKGEDEAGGFEYLVDALRLLNQGNDPIELLSTVLTYHVSPGGKTLSEVAAANPVDTLQGGTITVNGTALEDADPDLRDPELILTDVLVTNGVIHAIDGVLLPVDILQSNGANDVDFVIGSNKREVFKTGRDDDLIDAKGGRDSILSGSGDDVVLAGSGRDFVKAGSGNDIVKGESGRDRLFGNSGDDMLDGGRGRDWISGGSGNDTIAGGEGNDWLAGGFGADTFVFEENGGHDTISFFVSGQDKIDLSAYGFSDFDEIDIERKGFFRSEIDLGDTEITVNHLFFGLSESDFML